jgi:hypothetical protein
VVTGVDYVNAAMRLRRSEPAQANEVQG